MSQPNIIPALRYKDGKAAVDFLARAFGFEKLAVYESADGTVGHAELSFGPGLVMLGSAGEVDALFKQAVAAGANGAVPPEDMFWGDRFAIVIDPFGHRWMISGPLKK